MHFVILLIMVVLIAFFMQRILKFLVDIHFFFIFSYSQPDSVNHMWLFDFDIFSSAWLSLISNVKQFFHATWVVIIFFYSSIPTQRNFLTHTLIAITAVANIVRTVINCKHASLLNTHSHTFSVAIQLQSAHSMCSRFSNATKFEESLCYDMRRSCAWRMA